MACRRPAYANLLRACAVSAGPAATRRVVVPIVSTLQAPGFVAARTWPAPRFGLQPARLYSQAAGSKIWSFEDIQKVTSEAQPSVVVVDTREPGELQQTGRIPGALNIPISSAPDSFHIKDEDFEDRFGYPRPAKDAEVVFYCKAGVRSRAAAGLAKQAGWTKVGEYPGSWLDWFEKGGKVER